MKLLVESVAGAMSKGAVRERYLRESAEEPSVYVGTYAKYNNGSIDGEWVKLTDFDTYDEFVDYCRKLHSDEDDPEFMVQDFEGFPRAWYHESGLPTEEEFDKIVELGNMDDDEREAYEAYLGEFDGDFDDFRERYQGKYDSEEDFAQQLLDDVGMPDDLENYFDYDAFGRDMMYDFHEGDPDNKDADGEPEKDDHYYDNDGYDLGEYRGERQAAEDYVDGLGGLAELGKETLSRYFDYEAFARDLFMSDYSYVDGFVFRAD